MSETFSNDSSGISVESLFIRERNVLLTRAEFSDLYVDYYLQLADLHERYAANLDSLFKEALAAMVLHSASRPWNEVCAWTINFQEPLANFFVAGDNPKGTVVGTIFTENIRESEGNMMFAEFIRGNSPKRRSVVDFDTKEIFEAVEHFYRQSEQRIARYFRVRDEEYWMFSAQPDCDEAWLKRLELNMLEGLEQAEEFSLLEKRNYRWDCGCSEEKMFELLAPTFRADPEMLYQGEEVLRMKCPRCGKPYLITKEGLEAYTQEDGKEKAGEE
ncbi:MAG: Hsp33 family molecular chaperone HslO [Verrucomicrobiota bacterium]